MAAEALRGRGFSDQLQAYPAKGRSRRDAGHWADVRVACDSKVARAGPGRQLRLLGGFENSSRHWLHRRRSVQPRVSFFWETKWTGGGFHITLICTGRAAPGNFGSTRICSMFAASRSTPGANPYTLARPWALTG